MVNAFSSHPTNPGWMLVPEHHIATKPHASQFAAAMPASRQQHSSAPLTRQHGIAEARRAVETRRVPHNALEIEAHLAEDIVADGEAVILRLVHDGHAELVHRPRREADGHRDGHLGGSTT